MHLRQVLLEKIPRSHVSFFPQGDSGGPMVSKVDSNWVQLGIVSFGIECGLLMLPGVYTRVSMYNTWISNITRGSTPGFVDFLSSGVDPNANFTCGFPTPPRITTTTAATTDGNNIFDSSENMIHCSLITHFSSLCFLALSVYLV